MKEKEFLEKLVDSLNGHLATGGLLENEKDENGVMLTANSEFKIVDENNRISVVFNQADYSDITNRSIDYNLTVVSMRGNTLPERYDNVNNAIVHMLFDGKKYNSYFNEEHLTTIHELLKYGKFWEKYRN